MKLLSSLVLFLAVCWGVVFITNAMAEDGDDWQYDPDPSIDKIWIEVNRLQVEADRVDKKIEMGHRLRASPDLRKRLAQVALNEAQFTLDSKRAVLRTMMQQVK